MESKGIKIAELASILNEIGRTCKSHSDSLSFVKNYRLQHKKMYKERVIFSSSSGELCIMIRYFAEGLRNTLKFLEVTYIAEEEKEKINFQLALIRDIDQSKPADKRVQILWS